MSLRPPRPHKRIAGALCLDFANTVGEWVPEAPSPSGFQPQRDWLASFEDLLSWCREAAVAPAAELDRLERWAARYPGEAEAEFGRALRLRRALYGTFRAAAASRAAEASDLALLSAELRAFRGSQEVVQTVQGLELASPRPASGATALLGPLVESALAISAGGGLAKVKVCGGEECGWLFLDTSRTGRRRWCDMKDCGNLAKVRRFRARERTSAA